MATWIAVEDTVFEHHKIADAAAQLAISEVHLVGNMVALWLFTLRHAWRDGDLSAWKCAGIARAAKWTGDADVFVGCLRSVGLMDEYTIHNWTQRAGQIVRDRLRKERERSRKFRGRSRKVRDIPGLSAVPDPTRPDPTREDPTRRKEPSVSRKPRPNGQLSDADFLQALKSNPAYTGIDIDVEIFKMDAWFMTPKARGRKKTHRFILNWLNRCERPVAAEPDSIMDRARRVLARRAKEGLPPI